MARLTRRTIALVLARRLFEGGLEGRATAFLPDELLQFAAPDVDSSFIQRMAADLLAQRGRGLIVVGARQPLAVHHLAYCLNVLLGNFGKTVTYTPAPPRSERTLPAAGTRFDTLLVLGANPIFTAPPDAGVASLLSAHKREAKKLNHPFLPGFSPSRE